MRIPDSDLEPVGPSRAGSRLRIDPSDLEVVPSRSVPVEAPGVISSGLRGVKQGATFDFGDEIVGGVRGLGRWLSGDGDLGDNYRAARDEERAADHAAQEAHPWAYGAGNVAGAVATGFIPGVGAARGASAAAALGRAALAGGVAGFGASESEGLGGQAADAAIGAGTGALVSRLLGGAPKRSVDRVVGDLTDGTRATLRDRLVGASGKKVSNVVDIVTGTPEIRAARGDLPALGEAIDGAIKKTGALLDEAYAGANTKTAGIKVSDVLGAIEKHASDDPGKAEISAAVRRQAENVLNSWGDRVHVSAQEVRTLASDIADGAFRGSPAIAPKTGQKTSQAVWGDLKDLISRNLDESANGGSDLVKTLNKRMSSLIDMQYAVRDKATRMSSPSTRLKDQIGNATDLGLALTNGPAFAAKKLWDVGGKKLATKADDKLGQLVIAAQNGSRPAQIAELAVRLGFSQPASQQLSRFVYARFGEGAEPQ